MGEIRFAIHPSDFKNYDTERIRESFLIEDIFLKDQMTCVYTHYDRLLVGGVNPVTTAVKLSTFRELMANYFLERRELGVINVGARATITVDGQNFDLDYKDALYVGSGAKEVSFNKAQTGEAKFYFNSAPAHTAYPTKKYPYRRLRPQILDLWKHQIFAPSGN
jgi:4-deoxy-L-threo-5-hexosulose-uronate ketol-isomerase